LLFQQIISPRRERTQSFLLDIVVLVCPSRKLHLGEIRDRQRYERLSA
jgi:hypothetical protein